MATNAKKDKNSYARNNTFSRNYINNARIGLRYQDHC